MSPDFTNKPDNSDPERPTPPYDDRRKSADIDPAEESKKEGVETAGATGPVADARGGKSTDKTGSPAEDERPAAEAGGHAEDDASVGPAHVAGEHRGEDMPEEES